MQSYYVDEWEAERVLLEATFTPLPFGGAWLLGTGREHQESLLDFGHIGSIGVHLSDHSAGRVGLAGDGSLRMTYKLTDEDARAARLRDRPRGRNPLRRRRHRGLPQHRAGSRFCARATSPTFEATTFQPSELRLEAFHPMGTARIVADPGAGVCAADGSVHGVDRPLRRRRLAVPDLGRRQPDDDHHRLLPSASPAGMWLPRTAPSRVRVRCARLPYATPAGATAAVAVVAAPEAAGAAAAAAPEAAEAAAEAVAARTPGRLRRRWRRWRLHRLLGCRRPAAGLLRVAGLCGAWPAAAVEAEGAAEGARPHRHRERRRRHRGREPVGSVAEGRPFLAHRAVAAVGDPAAQTQAEEDPELRASMSTETPPKSAPPGGLMIR